MSPPYNEPLIPPLLPHAPPISPLCTDLEASLNALVHGLGLELAFRDPSVHVFGLRNGVTTIGSDFLEVVAPMLETQMTTGNRWLQKKGGEATGYMLLFHSKDAKGDVEEMKKFGVQVAWDGVDKSPAHAFDGFHLNPKAFANTGVLPSVDSMFPSSDPDTTAYPAWVYAHDRPYPAVGEPGWLENAKRTGKYLKLIGVTLQTTSDPTVAAKRWAELFNVPLIERHDDGGVPAVVFSNAVIRFVKERDGNGDGIQRWLWGNRIDFSTSEDR